MRPAEWPEPGPTRISTNLNISFEFLEGEAILLRLIFGIAVASGTSCMSKSLKISPVLAAIGLEHSLALGSVIFSLGQTPAEDIDHAVNTCAAVIAKLREMSPLGRIQPRSDRFVGDPRRPSVWDALELVKCH